MNSISNTLYAWLRLSIAMVMVCAHLHAQTFDLQYAKHFKITPTEQGYWVDIIQPWAGAQRSYRILLWPKSIELPSDAPSNVIRIPANRMVTQSTTNIGLLATIGCEDSIVGFSDGKNINTPSLAKAYKEGTLKECGVQGQLNLESLIDLQPDVVLTYAISQADTSFFDKLELSHIPYLIMGSFVESSALARSEWGVLLGLLVGNEIKAQEKFKEISLNYRTLCNLTKQLKVKPKVFCNLPFGGVWYMPDGQSWMAKMIIDAGAEYPWSSGMGEGSLQLPPELVYEGALNADIWLNPSQNPNWTTENIAELDARYLKFKALKNKKCLVPTRQVNEYGGNNIFELGIARPDLVLSDLIYHLHPNLLPKYEPVFYRWMQSHN